MSNSLIDAVVANAKNHPDRQAFVVLGEDGSKYELTDAQLHAEVVTWARALQANGIKPGDLLLIVLSHSAELITAFWGAIYLGAIPSILQYYSEQLDAAAHRERIATLAESAQARAIITLPELKEALATQLTGTACRVLGIDELSVAHTNDGEVLPASNRSGEDIAFVQFSSGTGGVQKGVTISHRAILAFVKKFTKWNDVTADDVNVTWLPMYHDMGLIYSMLAPVVQPHLSVMLSPFQWVRSPIILFEAIHEYRGTLCRMPNFAFNHSVRSVRHEDLAGLDLSSLRMMVNGAEPLQQRSIEMFLEHFASFGFQETALAAGYGMAEATIAICLTRPAQRPNADWVDRHQLQEAGRAVSVEPGQPGSTALVSCGYPLPGLEVEIRDEQGQTLGERQVGEVVFRGDTLFSHYHLQPELTAETMRDGWFYTGDLAYWADGELYICGRKSDLIIVAGNNIYPQYVEHIADAIQGMRPGRSVAFGVADEMRGTQGIVLVGELDRAHFDRKRQIEIELRRRVVQELGVALSEVHLLEQRWVVKTTSAKLARSTNREKYFETLLG